MWEARALYDVLALLYVPSLALFFIDAIQPRRKFNRIALLLLFCVFLCETVLLLVKLHELGDVAVYSRFDALLLISWVILLIALVVDAFFRVDLFLFFANVLGFTFVLFDSFASQGGFVYAAHQRDLLVLHISLALISYALFSLSFVLSGMYLIQEKLLVKKAWNSWYLRLPSLERLDTFAFRSVVAGSPLLLLSGILGVIWSWLVLGKLSLFDPKSIATFILWLLYGGYIVMRVARGWGGTRLAWYNHICFLCVVVNFSIVGDLSLFHHGT